jgi:NADP-dependent 3-hydroxy acid dehydrogenase YdfG
MIAFITGASSGIGRATAIALAEKGYDLVVCGRRQERLDELCEELQKKVRTHSLLFDVRDKEAVKRAISSLPKVMHSVDVLINNAGNAHGLAAFHEANVNDWDNMIDGNVKGLLYVSHAIVPGMVERRRGHIVNISSVAGKQTYANGAVYCASKKAVEAISEGMRLDLTQHGIRITNIAPGAVETEFSVVRFKGDHERAAKIYEGYKALTPKDVADAIIFAVTAPVHITIADMTIYPSAQSAPTVVHKNK